jgi:hypothetical protein
MKRLFVAFSLVLLVGWGETPTQPAFAIQPHFDLTAFDVGEEVTYKFVAYVTIARPLSPFTPGTTLKGNLVFDAGLRTVTMKVTDPLVRDFSFADVTYSSFGADPLNIMIDPCLGSSCPESTILLYSDFSALWIYLEGPPAPTMLSQILSLELVVSAETNDPENKVGPENKDDCKNDGYEDYGFRNQGQCIRFVNTGKDSRG